MGKSVSGNDAFIISDDVLAIAAKLYKFVENKR